MVNDCMRRSVGGVFLFDAVCREWLCSSCGRWPIWGRSIDLPSDEQPLSCSSQGGEREEVVVWARELLRCYGVLYPEPLWYQTVPVKYLASSAEGMRQENREVAEASSGEDA